MTQNYEIVKQILKETLVVKLNYEGIIKQAMSIKGFKKPMRKIIRKSQGQSETQRPEAIVTKSTVPA